MKINLLFISGLVFFLLLVDAANCQDSAQTKTVTPLNMGELKNALSFVRECETSRDVWPRVVQYGFKIYDFKTDTFAQEEKTITIKKKPLRIIPHAVGVADILWAICPRERLVAFNEFSADPEFSFIAAEVRAKGPIF
jgi:iron complex transport system substrate-binding protein